MMIKDDDKIWEQFNLLRPQKEETLAPTKKNNDYVCKCGGRKVFNDDNLPVCTACAVVDNHYIDDSPEWISNVSEGGKVNDPSRCGMPKDLELFSQQWGVSSQFSTSGRSSYASRRLAKISLHQSMNHKDRALFHAYNDITRGAQIISVPEAVIRQAKILYNKFNKEKLTRGAVRKGIKANCVLFACKLANISRTTKEVADAFEIPSKDVSRTTQLFKEIFLGTQPQTQSQSTVKITKPTDVVLRLFNSFNIPQSEKKQIKIKSLKMCTDLEKCVELMGKTPNSIASVILYLNVCDRFSKQEVCSKCEISLPTLNKIEILVKKYLEENTNSKTNE